MEGFDWNQAISGYGLFLVVGTLVVVFKGVVGPYWTDLINRAATLVLCIGLAVAATFAHGEITGIVVPWYTALGAGLNGVICAGSLLGLNSVYVAQVRAEA